MMEVTTPKLTTTTTTGTTVPDHRNIYFLRLCGATCMLTMVLKGFSVVDKGGLRESAAKLTSPEELHPSPPS